MNESLTGLEKHEGVYTKNIEYRIYTLRFGSMNVDTNRLLNVHIYLNYPLCDFKEMFNMFKGDIILSNTFNLRL